jgi:hypothetical protein
LVLLEIFILHSARLVIKASCLETDGPFPDTPQFAPQGVQIMKKALIAMSMVLAFAGVSFAADAAAPVDQPAAEAAAPAKKAPKKVKKAVKKAKKAAPAAEEKKAE